jgi:hypothetical protein
VGPRYNMSDNYVFSMNSLNGKITNHGMVLDVADVPWASKQVWDEVYFSYSTGYTHNIAYATGENPYGLFSYQGVLVKPILGGTKHHAVVHHIR